MQSRRAGPEEPDVLPVGPRAKIQPTAKPGSSEERTEVNLFWERVYENQRKPRPQDDEVNSTALHTAEHEHPNPFPPATPKSSVAENSDILSMGLQSRISIFPHNEAPEAENSHSAGNAASVTKPPRNGRPSADNESYSASTSHIVGVNDDFNVTSRAETSEISRLEYQVVRYEQPISIDTIYENYWARSSAPLSNMDSMFETLTLCRSSDQTASQNSQPHPLLGHDNYLVPRMLNSKVAEPSDIADLRKAVSRGNLAPELLSIAERAQEVRALLHPIFCPPQQTCTNSRAISADKYPQQHI